jgi:hypothetical protein
MQVVARQQNYLAGPDDNDLSTLTFDANAKRAFDDIVINNQMRRQPDGRRAMLGRDACRNASGREEISV